MSVDHSHHIEDPNATTPPPQFEVVGSVPTPPVPDPSEAMTVLVTLPPGSAGTPPHRHTGPAFGYVIEGEMIFELEGVGFQSPAMASDLRFRPLSRTR